MREIFHVTIFSTHKLLNLEENQNYTTHPPNFKFHGNETDVPYKINSERLFCLWSPQ